MALFAPLTTYSNVLADLSHDTRSQLIARVVSSLDGNVVFDERLTEVETWCKVMNAGGQFVVEVNVDSLIRHRVIDNVYDEIPADEVKIVSEGSVVVTRHEYGCSLYALYKGSLVKIASVIDFNDVRAEDIVKIVSVKECQDALCDVARCVHTIQFFRNHEKFPESLTRSVVEEARARHREALTEALLLIKSSVVEAKEQHT